MTKPPVVIIAGGENSRFTPLNLNTYKGTISLFGKPLIIRALESLAEHGFHKVVVVVSPKNYQGQGLSSVVDQAGLKLEVSYVLQPEAKGMGDALLLAREQVGDRFIVTSGYQLDLGELADRLLENPQENVVCSAPTDQPWEYGILSLTDDRATGIVEKPAKGKEPSNQKVQSIYVLNQDFLKTLSALPESEYNFEKALDMIMKEQEVGVVQLQQSLPSLKYVWHLYDFQEFLFQHAKTKISDQAKVADSAVIDDSTGPVIIEAGAQINHAAKIIGPCYIGENVLIGEFSFVRGGCSIETGCVIGSNTEVVRSIILSHTNVHYGYIADSIIGSHVKIGAGLITANKRLDRGSITVTVKGRKIDTGRSSVGTFIGNDTNVGIRVSTMPGVSIGSGATIYPGVTVYRNLDHQQSLRE